MGVEESACLCAPRFFASFPININELTRIPLALHVLAEQRTLRYHLKYMSRAYPEIELNSSDRRPSLDGFLLVAGRTADALQLQLNYHRAVFQEHSLLYTRALNELR